MTATLVKRLKSSRPNALLLDGGDTWQGSATALWTQGQDMVDAAKLLGVNIMTAHWEFTLGADRVRQLVDNDLKGAIDFVAQQLGQLLPRLRDHALERINPHAPPSRPRGPVRPR